MSCGEWSVADGSGVGVCVVGGGVLSFLSGFRLLERNAIEVLNLKYSF